MVDRTTAAVSTPAATAEIATLRQKLAAAAARIQEEMGRHKATEAAPQEFPCRTTSTLPVIGASGSDA
jgi:hypothetical protein